MVMLSPRELEVLTWLASPHTLARIGGELFISLSTVKNHTNHIYRKLGVASRAEAVEHARAAGLLELSTVHE